MPAHRFLVLGLAQALQQPDAGLVGIKRIDVINHDEAVAMPIEA
jgi:hypothetical protein